MEEIKEISFDELVPKFDKMIWKLSKKYKHKNKTNYEEDELYQFGLFGLWKASEGFNSGKGASFSTYAYINISGHIMNAINKEKEIDLTRSDVKRKEEVANLLWLKEENGWTWEETQKHSGLTNEELNEAIEWNKNPISINSTVKRNECGDGDVKLVEVIPGDLGIEEKIVAKETVNEVFKGLDELEQSIIHFRFVEGFSKAETSDILKIPQTTYRRKEEKLLQKIKDQKDLH